MADARTQLALQTSEMADDILAALDRVVAEAPRWADQVAGAMKNLGRVASVDLTEGISPGTKLPGALAEPAFALLAPGGVATAATSSVAVVLANLTKGLGATADQMKLLQAVLADLGSEGAAAFQKIVSGLQGTVPVIGLTRKQLDTVLTAFEELGGPGSDTLRNKLTDLGIQFDTANTDGERLANTLLKKAAPGVLNLASSIQDLDPTKIEEVASVATRLDKLAESAMQGRASAEQLMAGVMGASDALKGLGPITNQ